MSNEFTDIVITNLVLSVIFIIIELIAILYTIPEQFKEDTDKSLIKIFKKVLRGINILLILLYLLSIVFDSIYLATNKNILNINYIDIFILTLVEFVYNILIFFEYNIYYLEDLEDAIKTVTSYFL